MSQLIGTRVLYIARPEPRVYEKRMDLRFQSLDWFDSGSLWGALVVDDSHDSSSDTHLENDVLWTKLETGWVYGFKSKQSTNYTHHMCNVYIPGAERFQLPMIYFIILTDYNPMLTSCYVNTCLDFESEKYQCPCGRRYKTGIAAFFCRFFGTAGTAFRNSVMKDVPSLMVIPEGTPDMRSVNRYADSMLQSALASIEAGYGQNTPYNFINNLRHIVNVKKRGQINSPKTLLNLVATYFPKELVDPEFAPLLNVVCSFFNDNGKLVYVKYPTVHVFNNKNLPSYRLTFENDLYGRPSIE